MYQYITYYLSLQNLDVEPDNKGQVVLISRVKSDELLNPQYISAVNIIQITDEDKDHPIIDIHVAPLKIKGQHAPLKFEQQVNNGTHLLVSSSCRSTSMPLLNDMKVVIMADLHRSVSASQPQLVEVTPRLAEQFPISSNSSKEENRYM